MHAEVAIRVDLQEKLYYQNDTMFAYISDLLKAQKKNARTMKVHVTSLQEELYTLQQERAVLVEKITAAQTTKEAIKSIEVQQESLEQRILEAQNARRAAVVAGQQQSVENQVRHCARERGREGAFNIEENILSFLYCMHKLFCFDVM
jgi:hypothetical protein